MRCAGCGRENRDGSKFCIACGTPLGVSCPACGTPRDPGDTFCRECGACERPARHPHVQYVTTSDSVRIAYATFGGGAGVPLVFLRPYFYSHVGAEWRYWPPESIDSLAQRRLVVRLDFRGGGLSDRDVADRSVAARVCDLEAVVDRLGLERFAIYAATSAALATFAYAARHPARVSHLVLLDAWTRGFGDWDTPRFQALRALAEVDWQLGTEAIASLVGSPASPARSLAALMREALTRDDFVAITRADWGIDLAPLLPQIDVPALVCSFAQTAHAVRPDLARQLVSGLRNARLISIRSTEDLLHAIEDFLADAPPAPLARPIPAAAATAFRTILFTDLEGHTEMMQRLGDERGRAVLRVHERLTREALRMHGGTEVKTMGDGFVASFTSATRAVECAVALQRAFAHHAEAGGEPLRLRVGVNAGEPIAENGDLFGAAVIIAGRLAADANGGQIVVADVVRQLVAGREFVFGDRGETSLKGIPAPIRTWELLW